MQSKTNYLDGAGAGVAAVGAVCFWAFFPFLLCFLALGAVFVLSLGFVMLVLVLVLRPGGLFGQRVLG